MVNLGFYMQCVQYIFSSQSSSVALYVLIHKACFCFFFIILFLSPLPVAVYTHTSGVYRWSCLCVNMGKPKIDTIRMLSSISLHSVF